MSIVLDALRTLLSTKQKEGGSLHDYTKRFRVARDVLKSHIGGPIVLTKIVEATAGYADANKAKREKIEEQAFNQFLGFLYLDNADKQGKVWINPDRFEHATVTRQRPIPEEHHRVE
jgi:hypothetical protein